MFCFLRFVLLPSKFRNFIMFFNSLYVISRIGDETDSLATVLLILVLKYILFLLFLMFHFLCI